MSATLAHWFTLLTSLDFWNGLLASFADLGPVAPVALAMIESLIPALPLVAIVTLNVAGHGPIFGFLYSWFGSCLGCTIVFLFFRLVFQRLFARWGTRSEKVKKAREWVESFDPTALFLISILPFTPSSFLNFAFGVSAFDPKKYLLTIYAAKLIMIGLLAVFGQSCVAALHKPWVLLLSIAAMVALYAISVKVRQRHNLK